MVSVETENTKNITVFAYLRQKHFFFLDKMQINVYKKKKPTSHKI